MKAVSTLFTFALLPLAALAQVSGPATAGESRAIGTFDPTERLIQPRVPIDGRTITIPRPPVIPQSDYDQRKRVTPRAPATSAATPDARISYTLGNSAYTPDAIPRDPIISTPSRSFPLLPHLQFQPPSPNLAAGPEDLLLIVNSFLARYNRTGENTYIVNLNQFFNANVTTWCPSLGNNCVIADPQVRYDQIHGRFIVTAQARDYDRGTSHFMIAVTKGATFMGGWRVFALDAQLEGSVRTANWADFPQMGFDDKALYITALMFNNTSTFQYSKLRIVKKSDLYHPTAATLPWREIAGLKNEDGTFASTLQPAHMRGRSKLGVEPALLINTSDASGATYFTLWRINNPLSDAPTVSRITINGVWPYDYPAPAPQQGTNVLLDTGASSILKAIYRDGVVFVAYNAKHSDATSTVAYARIDLETAKITLQARWIGGYYFYPSFDVPASLGPVNALHKQVTGTTTDRNGMLTFAGVTDVKAGEDIYDTRVGATARWGDYFGGAIDPIDGGLWVSGQYASRRVGGIAQYGSWGAYFPWSTNQVFEDVPATNPFFHFVNVVRYWGVTIGCSTVPANYCPTSAVTRDQMAAFIIRSIYGENFSVPGVPYFKDVPQTHPFFKYIQKLREQNITVGCAADQYCPNDTTTRGQMAAFLIRAKLGPLFGTDFTYPTTAYFKDVPSTDPMFPHIQKLRELGITSGCAADQFCPTSTITREQMAVFLTRSFFN